MPYFLIQPRHPFLCNFLKLRHAQARTCSSHQSLSGSNTCMSDASGRIGTQDSDCHADFREHDVPSHLQQAEGNASIGQSDHSLNGRTADVTEAPSAQQSMLRELGRERGREHEVSDRPATAGARRRQIRDITEANGVQGTHGRVQTHAGQGLHLRHGASVPEGKHTVEDVTSQNDQPSVAGPEMDGGHDSSLDSRPQHGQPGPHLFTSDPVATLAGSRDFCRIATHGILCASHFRSGRFSESCTDDGGVGSGSESTKTAGTVRRPSDGMPAKKLVARRWREVRNWISMASLVHEFFTFVDVGRC